MKPPALQKLLLGAGYTIRYARGSSSASGDWTYTVGDAPQRFVVVSLLAGSLEWRSSSAITRGTLEAGGSLLLSPGENLTLHAAKKPNQRRNNFTCELTIVSLEPSVLLDAALRHNFVSRAVEIKLRERSVPHDKRLRSLTADLRDELLAEAPGRDSYVGAIVDQLTIHILREHAVFRTDAALELSRVGLVDRRIRRAIELMHAHLERDLPLEELAAAAYLSSFHFARLFKKLTGTSPHAYLAAIRMAEAERLLADTDLSITEISQRVGYGSPSHFAKAFRAATGLSPRAFRASVVRRTSASD